MNLTPDQLAARIRELAAEQVHVDVATVTDETRFAEDLNYDSLEMVEFTMNLEEEFEIDIPDEEATDVRTVGQAVDLARKLLDTVSPTSP